VGALVLLALLLGAGASSAQARVPPGAPDPHGSAAIVIDADTGEVLLGEGRREPHSIASATKLMTALLTLERTSLKQTFTAVPYHAMAAESRIGLRAGERMRVRDLLVALLLESANDASVTLAEGIGGSRAGFVRLMNDRARELGLRTTSYANPIGLDDPDNYSSAQDLATLARTLMRDRRFASIVDRPNAALRSGSRDRVVDNRNLLVRRYAFVDGVKTGHTAAADYVLVGSASKPGARVISVVLGEPSAAARDADSVALLRWGLDRFARVRVLERGRAVRRVPVEGFDGRRVGLAPARGVAVTVRRGRRAVRRIEAPDELSGPLPAGRAVGSVTVAYGGRDVRRVPLVTTQAVPEAGLLRRLDPGLSAALVALALLALGLAALARSGARGRRGRQRTPVAR
jgi:D-alanyl-D-alanine carboxypeptidase (penicillin-binding protein 5/6)